MFKKELILLAAGKIKDVYSNPQHNRGSTEWSENTVLYENKPLQVLSIGGSDDPLDWAWNFVMASWDGVKLCSYISAKRILKNFTKQDDMPLLVCGHSKAGPTAEYLGKRLNADYCISFCPAPGFRKREKLKNTLLVIDPDDLVPHAGKLSFKLSGSEFLLLKADKKKLDIKGRMADHSIDHIMSEISALY